MDILIILVLILLNGLFAMSEIALVSSRKARLQQKVDEGHHGAEAALKLANEPSHFLSTVQVGITSIGILNGAFGEAAIADKLSVYFASFPLIAPYSHGLALVVMVITITYLSVILGELVPKRLALINPEGIAMAVAKPMQRLARLTLPLVKSLSASSEIVIRLLKIRMKDDPPITEEEINVLMEQGAEAGIFEESEAALVSNILRMDQQSISTIMTPHVDMTYVDLEDSEDEIKSKLIASPHSFMPVCRGGLDHVVGILAAKDLLARSLNGDSLDIATIVKPPLYFAKTLSIADLLESFKKSDENIGLVVDDYGNIMGLVTLDDVLEAITSDLLEEPDATEAVRREDGSWLMDGMLSCEQLRQVLEIDDLLPGEAEENFRTLGGFVMAHLGRVPKVTDHFEWHGFRFEVVDMDRNRIDKILVSKASLPEDERDG